MTTPWIAGCGLTTFGRHEETGLDILAAIAARDALLDARIPPAKIGLAVFANALAARLSGSLTIGQDAFAHVGLAGCAVLNVENACTSGSSAFHIAVMAIRAGEVEAALVVGAEKMFHPALGLIDSGRTLPDTLLGRVTPAGFALRASRHMQRFGTTAEQLAAVSVKNRRSAATNPNAMMRDPISVRDVLSAPMVVDPLTRLQCSPIADGAAAMVLVNDRLARQIGARTHVRASVLTSGTYDQIDDLAEWRTDGRSAQMAYERAGVSAGDLDVVECHDAFSIAEILHYEGLGLCPVGEGGRYAERLLAGDTACVPVNPSGGLMSRGHPVGATGIAQIIEITRYLEKCGGHRPGRLGLAHCMGGDKDADTKSCTVAIVERKHAVA
ncbi:thiolase family protein [Martelella soudanensis]|uniref:thiolase family protein n=1 Tax=unclassified Martelella TaxID=2629616 RepID=UPI0015DF157D|nr:MULTISPECIES: thiolase family protein [unclassified Martelella]